MHEGTECKAVLSEGRCSEGARRPRPGSKEFLDDSPHTERSSASTERYLARVPHTARPGSTGGHVESSNRRSSSSRQTSAGGRGNWRRADATPASHRRFVFQQWDNCVPGYHIPHGTSSSGGLRQLKSFDIILPKWVDTSVPEQRMHLRLYYSDMLAAPPVTPPIEAGADTWEVEQMKKFVLEAKPRTRLDAYPLLIATQDVLRRVADKEVRIISSREAMLEQQMSDLNEVKEQLERELTLARHELQETKASLLMSKATFMFKPKGNDPAALEAYNKAQEELREMQAELERLRQANLSLLDQVMPLKKEIVERDKKVAQLESKLRTLKQQNDAMLAKMDNVAGMSKLDHWSMWSESDRREVLLKKAFPDKELMALCTIAGISKVWVQLGSCSLKKFVDFQIRESFSKDKDALTKLCFLTGREVPEFVISGLTYRTTNPALHSSLAEHLPEMMDAMIALKYDKAPNLLRVLGERWLKASIEEDITLLDLLIAVLGKQVRDLLLEQLHANDVPIITAEVETQTDVIEEETPAAKAKAAKAAKKRKPLYPGAGSAKAMAHDSAIRLVHEAYEVKILADIKDDDTGRARQPFTEFFKDFLVRKYGLKTIAMKHLAEIMASVEKNAQDVQHMLLFGRISGMIMPDSLELDKWTPRMPDFVLGVLSKACVMEGRALSNISEWLSGDRDAGIGEDAALFAVMELSETCNLCPLTEEKVKELKLVPHNQIGLVSAHALLLWCVDFFYFSQDAMREGFMKVFIANDTNGDGVLEIGEFRDLIQKLLPDDAEMDDRRISSLYNEVCNVDDDEDTDSVSKEAFAQIALLYNLRLPPEFLSPDVGPGPARP